MLFLTFWEHEVITKIILKEPDIVCLYRLLTLIHIEAYEPKWVNPNDIWNGVNSLKLEGLHVSFSFIYSYGMLITVLTVDVYVYVCVWVCLCGCVCVGVCIWVCVCVWVCPCGCVWVWVCLSVSECVSVCRCVRECDLWQFYYVFLPINTFDILVLYVLTDVIAFSCDDLIYATKYIGHCVQKTHVRSHKVYLLFKHIFNI